MDAKNLIDAVLEGKDPTKVLEDSLVETVAVSSRDVERVARGKTGRESSTREGTSFPVYGGTLPFFSPGLFDFELEVGIDRSVGTGEHFIRVSEIYPTKTDEAISKWFTYYTGDEDITFATLNAAWKDKRGWEEE